MKTKFNVLIGFCLIIAGLVIVAYGYPFQTEDATLILTVTDTWDIPIYNAKVTMYFWEDPFHDLEPIQTLEYYTDQSGQVTYSGYYFVNGLQIEKSGYDTFYNKGWIWEGAHTIKLSGGEPPEESPEEPPPDVGPPITIPDLPFGTEVLGFILVAVGVVILFVRW